MKNMLSAICMLLMANYLFAQNVGVGTTTPVEKLTVAGNVKADTIKPTVLKLTTDAGEGKILTSDAAGNASWRTSAGTTGSNVGFGAWGDCATNQAISEYNPVSDAAGETGDSYGNSVAISGDYAVVGSVHDDVGANLNQGSASVYHYDGNNWVFVQKLVDPAGEASDNFGNSVTISDNFIVIGAFHDNGGSASNQGSVSVFRLIGSTWTYQTKFTGGVAGDLFGSSVSLDGIYLAVGCPARTVGPDQNQGVVFTYRFDGTNWVQMAVLNDALGEAQDALGESVCISGDFLVAGAPFANTVTNGIYRGSVVTWRRSGTSWILMQRFTGAADGDYFGYAVSISGDVMVVGAPSQEVGANTNQGAVRIYRRNGAVWNFMYQLFDLDGNALDAFGEAVSIAGNYLMIGARGADIGTHGAQGNTTVYQKIGNGFQKLQLIIDPGGATGDAFGAVLAIDNSKRFLISAPGFSDYGKVVFGKVN